MLVRKAKMEDWEQILYCYQKARQYMKDTGNGSQWGDHHPPEDMLKEDIELGQLYVCVAEDDKVHGVFVFLLGEDPTYGYVKDGAWLNNEAYGTIHRIAGDGEYKGVFKAALAYCQSQINNIRADTHENNKTMQHLFEKYGFKKVGIIFLLDGRERIAYHLAAK